MEHRRSRTLQWDSIVMSRMPWQLTNYAIWMYVLYEYLECSMAFVRFITWWVRYQVIFTLNNVIYEYIELSAAFVILMDSCLQSAGTICHSVSTISLMHRFLYDVLSDMSSERFPKISKHARTFTLLIALATGTRNSLSPTTGLRYWALHLTPMRFRIECNVCITRRGGMVP